MIPLMKHVRRLLETLKVEVLLALVMLVLTSGTTDFQAKHPKMKKKVVSKLLKHVEDGDLHRLKYYVRKYGVPLDARLRKGQTLMHRACHHGHQHIMIFLMKNGCEVFSQDEKGRSPAHLCLQAAIDKHLDKFVLSDLIEPMLRADPSGINVCDNSGISVKDLIEKLRDISMLKEQYQDEEGDSCSSSSGDAWEERLQQEMEDEYASMGGKYEDDFYGNPEPEDIDDWADRIRQEYNLKNKVKHEPGNKKKTKSEESGSLQTDEERAAFHKKLEQEHQEYLRRAEITRNLLLRSLKQQYEQRLRELARRSAHASLAFDDIPWPVDRSQSCEQLEELLLCDLNQDDYPEVSRVLKEQRVCWHPDKFVQKYGSLLSDDSRESVMERVKEISQMINKICEKYKK